MTSSLRLFVLILATAIACEPGAAQQKPSVAIIGTGTLARALGPAMGRQGYSVIYGSRNPARDSVRALVERTGSTASAAGPQEAAGRAEIIVLAVPGEVVEDVAVTLGRLDGRIVIDVSGGEKRVAPDGYLELVSDSTRAERIQAAHPAMRVVRVNLPSIVFFLNPTLTGTRPTVLIAANDPGAREAAAQIMFDLGVDPWDAGPLRFSRVFDAFNVMSLVPAQQGRVEAYELRLMPTVPLACFIDVGQLFGFGKPYDLKALPRFPRRDPLPTCDDWGRRLR